MVVFKETVPQMNEDKGIEYKSELTNKLKREIVSFLNTKGGTIFLGIDDQTRKPLEVSYEHINGKKK